MGIASIFMILTGSTYEKIDKEMGRISYFVGQIMYGFGLLLVFEYFDMNKWITTGLYVLAILVFYDLYRRLKHILIAWLIAMVSLISYFTFVSSVWNSDTLVFETLMKYGWIGLFILAFTLKIHLLGCRF